MAFTGKKSCSTLGGKFAGVLAERGRAAAATVAAAVASAVGLW